MPRWLARPLVKHIIVNAVGRMENYGLPKPAHHPFDATPSVSGEFLTRVGCGDITMKPNIAALRGKQVRFCDGSSEDIDVIIYATGYNIAFPFLGADLLNIVDNHMPLFKRIWKPTIPNLMFVGLAQPLPTLVNFAEQQAKLITAFITGEYTLPSPAEMNETIARDEARDIGRSYRSRRTTQNVSFDSYRADLCKEIRRGMARANARSGGTGWVSAAS
jgi:hypothetical protein